MVFASKLIMLKRKTTTISQVQQWLGNYKGISETKESSSSWKKKHENLSLGGKRPSSINSSSQNLVDTDITPLTPWPLTRPGRASSLLVSQAACTQVWQWQRRVQWQGPTPGCLYVTLVVFSLARGDVGRSINAKLGHPELQQEVSANREAHTWKRGCVLVMHMSALLSK